ADGWRLASAGRDGLVFVHALDGRDIEGGAIDGRDIDGGDIGNGEANGGGSPRTTVLSEHTAGVECVGFTGDAIVSGALDGKVRLHRDGRLIRTYTGMNQPVRALARGDRGGHEEIYVGLAGGTVRVLGREDDRHELVDALPG